MRRLRESSCPILFYFLQFRDSAVFIWCKVVDSDGMCSLYFLLVRFIVPLL